MANQLSKKKNVYSFNILKSSQVDLGGEYSYFISRLLHVESKILFGEVNMKDFAEEIHRVISSTRCFLPADRVCLSLAYPNSSKIKVVSSYNAGTLGPNTMESGYSCFVSSKSSLFELESSDVRTYGSMDDIIALYAGKPPQRSMARLAAMGIKSGITISIKISSLVSGFIFLNSKQPGAYDNLKAEDTTLLCLLKLIGTSVINKFIHGATGVDKHLSSILDGLPVSPNTFSKEVFERNLAEVLTAFSGQKKTVTVNNEAGAFMLAVKPFTYLIARVLVNTGALFSKDSFEFTASADETAGKIQLILKGGAIGTQKLAYLDDVFLFTDNDVLVRQSDLVFVGLLERPAEGVDYSV